MRCPFCGKINSDRALYCVSCGRDLPRQNQPPPTSGHTPPSNQRGYQQSYPPPRPHAGGLPQNQAYPPNTQQPPVSPQWQRGQQPVSAPPAPQSRSGHPAPPPPASRTQPARPTQVQQAAVAQKRSSPVAPVPPPPVAPPPEPPAPFPPRTAAHLHALETGALTYTLLDSKLADGKKKIVRIAYERCTGWQQVATLLKAFREQQEERFTTIIIQGLLNGQSESYNFTNGQLYFDRGVLLGSSKSNRYQIETGNGFESDSVRIVINE